MSIFVYVSIKVNAMVNIKPLHAVTKGNTGLFLITLNYFLYIQNDKSISIILTFLVVWGGGDSWHQIDITNEMSLKLQHIVY